MNSVVQSFLDSPAHDCAAFGGVRGMERPESFGGVGTCPSTDPSSDADCIICRGKQFYLLELRYA